MKFIIVCLNLFSLTFCFNANEQEYSLAPVAIRSELIELVSYDSALEFGIPKDNVYTLINDGFSIQVYSKKSWYITGGPLNGKTFLLNKVQFYWNGSYRDRCCHTVDGQGAALEAIFSYFDETFDNFNEASKKKNGVATVNYSIYVESQADNSKFGMFQNVFQNVLNPGSKTKTSSNILDWISDYRNNTTYYVYDGSYVTTFPFLKYDRNAKVMCLPRNEFSRISIKQFNESFGSALSGFGGSLSYSFPTHEASGKIVAVNLTNFIFI